MISSTITIKFQTQNRFINSSPSSFLISSIASTVRSDMKSKFISQKPNNQRVTESGISLEQDQKHQPATTKNHQQMLSFPTIGRKERKNKNEKKE